MFIAAHFVSVPTVFSSVLSQISICNFVLFLLVISAARKSFIEISITKSLRKISPSECSLLKSFKSDQANPSIFHRHCKPLFPPTILAVIFVSPLIVINASLPSNGNFNSVTLFPLGNFPLTLTSSRRPSLGETVAL